jgi:hypothetical protein
MMAQTLIATPRCRATARLIGATPHFETAKDNKAHD